MNTYPAPYWALLDSYSYKHLGAWSRARTTEKNEADPYNSRGKCYGFSAGEKQSYKAEDVSQAYTMWATRDRHLHLQHP